MKTEHEIFLREMAMHGDKMKAYTAAYPNASGRSLRESANRLARNKEIEHMLRISEEEARTNVKADLAALAYDRVKAEMVTIEQKRELLGSIIRGEHKTVRYVKLNGRLEEVREDPNIFALLRAIELDTKLANGYFDKPPAKPEKEKPKEKEPEVPRPVNALEAKLMAHDNSWGGENLPPNHPMRANTHVNPGKNAKWIDVYSAEEQMNSLWGYKTGYAAALGIPPGTTMKEWEGGKYINRLPPWYDKSKDPVEDDPFERANQERSTGPLIMPYQEREEREALEREEREREEKEREEFVKEQWRQVAENGGQPLPPPATTK